MTTETSNARGEWVLRLTALDGLVDRIAEAIRDGAGLAEGDPPWERLGEERRAPWRADAKRALSVIKESLTTEMGAGVGEPDVQYADADALIALGWTPPGAQQPAAEAQCGGEVVQRLRGVLQHAKMGNSYLISQDLIHKAIGAITAPPSAPVGVRNAILEALNLVHAEGRARVESATAEMADRLAALAQQPAAGVVDDTRRIRALADNYWRLEPFDMPTPGGDDADVGWRVIEFHRADPRERVVVEHYRDNPREAIDAALAAQQQGGAE